MSPWAVVRPAALVELGSPHLWKTCECIFAKRIASARMKNEMVSLGGLAVRSGADGNGSASHEPGEFDSTAVWLFALDRTRERSPASFDQWFAGVQFEGFTDGILSLRARDEFVRDWIDNHFLPFISDVLNEATGLSIRVAWSIGGPLESPVSTGVVPPPPVRPKTLRPTEGPVDGNVPDFAPQHLRAEGRARIEAPRPVAPRVDGLSDRYTFSNFVIGPSNQLAYAAAVACAGGGGRKHNPLFLCGGTGLGKTHLVHAMAHRIREEKPETRIVYLSAERFINEFVQALQDQKMGEFRAKYRDQCDLLLMDDIQFLANKTQTQEEFFHAFNALHQAGKQIVVTSDKYPQQLERMEERLVSRFTWGLVADIQAPELETRVAIVRKKANQDAIEVGDDVVLHIAQAVRTNVRELEGVLIRLAAKASLLGRTIDLDWVRAELAMTLPMRNVDASVEDIQRVVCHHFKLRSGDLVGKDRHKSIAFARHLAMFLARDRLKLSLPELGRAFGGRDHTTVMSGIRKIAAMRETNPEVRAHLDALERKLGLDE